MHTLGSKFHISIGTYITTKLWLYFLQNKYYKMIIFGLRWSFLSGVKCALVTQVPKSVILLEFYQSFNDMAADKQVNWVCFPRTL